MRALTLLVLTLSSLPLPAAADEATARLLIEKAITAHGGEAALSKYPVVTVKGDGIFHGYEDVQVFFFDSKVTTSGPDYYRSVFDGKILGQPVHIVHVLNRQQGWVTLMNETRDHTPAEVTSHQHYAYVHWINTLLPLRSRELTLSTVDDVLVRDRPAAGVRVVGKDRADVKLYFDKETSLHVQTTTMGKSIKGEKGRFDTIYTNYETHQGVQRPMMAMGYYEDHHHWTLWVREYLTTTAPAADMFDRPQ